ncbi:MAG: Gfo/Idh/MocA family oxidoreductase, partial [Mariprofundaceae bacterium]
SIVLNLTNPRSHYDLSKQCLEAGKHVYSEKPLAMDYVQAEELVVLAENSDLIISSAPCSLLGNTAQLVWHAVRHDIVGKVRAVYAELDDGMLHKMAYQKWKSASGAPWPYLDEFEVGCTLEHAGYYLAWLVAIFGPVKSVTSFSDCLIQEKVEGEALDPSDTPDFSVGIMKFDSGVVARLTTSIVGPHNHMLRVIGDDGVIEVNDCWHNDSKVRVRKLKTIRRKTFLSPISSTYNVVNMPKRKLKDTGSARMDFAAGVAELANAIQEKRPCCLSSRFSLHVNEVALALHQGNGTYEPRSRFKFISPMRWAQKAL